MSEYIIDMSSSSYKSESGLLCADVLQLREKIVRCRDCAWFTNSSHYGAYCTNFGSPLHDDYDGFCAWGERRTNE